MAKTVRYTKQEVDVHSIEITVPVRYGDEDIPNDAPGRTGDTWRAFVLVDSGQIERWPGGALDLYMKVCDEGEYRIYNPIGLMLGRVQDYVPHGVVPGEYGDYVKLDIDETGRIKNWPKASDLDFSAFGLGEREDGLPWPIGYSEGLTTGCSGSATVPGTARWSLLGPTSSGRSEKSAPPRLVWSGWSSTTPGSRSRRSRSQNLSGCL